MATICNIFKTRQLQRRLLRAATYLELLVGFVVLLACIACAIGMFTHTDVLALLINPDYLQDRLSAAGYIIIGIEFIKMIASHTLDSVIDVMMLALARQMIVEHTSAFENLLTVIAVGVLFVIRKYLYIAKIDHTPDEAVPTQIAESDRTAIRQ